MKNLYLLAIITLLVACKSRSVKTAQEDRIVQMPKFNSDNAFEYIKKQVEFGPRRMNSEAHEYCKKWLLEKLTELDFETELQNFEAKAYTGELLKGSNIQGYHNKHVKERILLCAHYDTRHIADKDTVNVENPIDGADDGASGVAVILEIARLVKDSNLPMGIDVVFFDAEDHGSDKPNQSYSWGLGSQYWANELRQTEYDYKYGILLDMVGSKNATFRKEGYSIQTSKSVVDQIWKLAKGMGRDQYFIDKQIGSITDDHRFIIEKTKIPMVDIINVQESGEFGHYHHRHSDNIEIIDKKTLKAVGQVITAHIFRESNKQNK
ncbi:MAG: glutaminyl-peptide cyclotransferase [Saprospiraceae bacterium]|jgi:glutaminyl-peptide cyclotransferase